MTNISIKWERKASHTHRFHQTSELDRGLTTCGGVASSAFFARLWCGFRSPWSCGPNWPSRLAQCGMTRKHRASRVPPRRGPSLSDDAQVARNRRAPGRWGRVPGDRGDHRGGPSGDRRGHVDHAGRGRDAVVPTHAAGAVPHGAGAAAGVRARTAATNGHSSPHPRNRPVRGRRRSDHSTGANWPVHTARHRCRRAQARAPAAHTPAAPRPGAAHRRGCRCRCGRTPPERARPTRKRRCKSAPAHRRPRAGRTASRWLR